MKDYFALDSFVIYMGIDGDTKITYSETEEIILKKGETILIPAILPEIGLTPLSKESQLLEVYID